MSKAILVDQPCRICTQLSDAPECVQVSGATQDVAKQLFTVWRCGHCNTLNAFEPVDYDAIYRNYPIQRQRYDVFAKLLFAKRLKILISAGLRVHHTVLDFGCGSGHFARYLKERGYDCEGYDPYNAQHCNQMVLQRQYDVVLCQDVIEHVDNPRDLLTALLGYVAPQGRLIIGTPYSDHVVLQNVIDQLGVLHQPFHRFIISKQQVAHFFRLDGWTLEQVIDACYMDTAFPFVNTQFLFHLFKSGDGLMDFAFGPMPVSHFIRHPSLLFWGFFGRLFAKRQDLFVVLKRVVNESCSIQHPTP